MRLIRKGDFGHFLLKKDQNTRFFFISEIPLSFTRNRHSFSSAADAQKGSSIDNVRKFAHILEEGS